MFHLTVCCVSSWKTDSGKFNYAQILSVSFASSIPHLEQLGTVTWVRLVS